MIDYSGSITTGGTAQTAVAANPNRRWLRVENPPSATESLFVRYDGTATTNSSTPNSTELAPGASDEFSFTGVGYIPGGAVSVIAATTGHKFIIKEE